MDSIAPLEVWRSEAFAEDLLDNEQAAARPARRATQGVLLCLLPLAVALVGGVLAFLHTIN